MTKIRLLKKKIKKLEQEIFERERIISELKLEKSILSSQMDNIIQVIYWAKKSVKIEEKPRSLDVKP